MVSHPENLQLGDRVDIGAFTYIQAQNGVIIHDDVQIGAHVTIYSENTIDETSGAVEIMEGARIGCHSMIFPGVRIGKNAKVGAHSVVKVDVPDDVTYTEHVLVKS